MYCPSCGAINDDDARFCVNCGAKIIKKIGRNPAAVKSKVKNQSSGMKKNAAIILIVIIIAGVGLASGLLLNKSTNNPLYGDNSSSNPYLTYIPLDDSEGMDDTSYKFSSEISKSFTIIGVGLTTTLLLDPSPKNGTIKDKTTDTPVPPNQQNKNNKAAGSDEMNQTFSEKGIKFNFPSNWKILEDGNSKQIISVGVSDYPSFAVNDDSGLGFNNLTDYVNESKEQISSSGYKLLSENKRSVDGLPAYELVFRGESVNGEKVTQMIVLVKNGSEGYFALVGRDKTTAFDETQSTFNQIIKTFNFT